MAMVLSAHLLACMTSRPHSVKHLDQMASVTYLGSPQLPSRLVAKLVAAKRAWERVVSMAITRG